MVWYKFNCLEEKREKKKKEEEERTFEQTEMHHGLSERCPGLTKRALCVDTRNHVTSAMELDHIDGTCFVVKAIHVLRDDAANSAHALKL